MDDIRYLRKRFRCHNCYKKFSKLVSFNEEKAKCIININLGEKCGNISFTIKEEEFMRITRSGIDKEFGMVFDKNKKNEEQKSTNNNNSFNKNSNLNRNPKNQQNTPRQSNVNNQQNTPRQSNVNSSNVNMPRANNDRARSLNQNQIPQSNNNRYNQNNSNYVYNQSNNINNSNTNNQRPRQETLNTNQFSDFLGFIGSDIINNNRRVNSNSHFNGNNISIRFNNQQPIIINHNFEDDVFDPIFMIFGSSFNNLFRNNFSSNFRSNFVNNDFASVIEESLRQGQNQSKPPASKEAIKKLRNFKMSEKYCKKNDKGLMEQPSCCVCISDIKKNDETLMLPCGHMFHSSCIMGWLGGNNNCPVCRFELPTN